MTDKDTVIIYVYELNDKKTTDERLAIAAKRYCREMGLQIETGYAHVRGRRSELIFRSM